MITTLYDTTTAAIADKLVEIREQGGATSLSRVLTLVVMVGADAAETAVKASNFASMEHPCRVIVLVERDREGSAALDAEIRVGGDAGASEVVILRLRGPIIDHTNTLILPLLLPDAPIVAWWPDRAPDDPSLDSVGALATRRVTDAYRGTAPLQDRLRHLSVSYAPGDTDLAWTRITWWRAHIAAMLEVHAASMPSGGPDAGDLGPGGPDRRNVARATTGEPDGDHDSLSQVSGGEDWANATAGVAGADITGGPNHASLDLMAAWLTLRLGCPTTITRIDGVDSLTGVTLRYTDGTAMSLHRPDGSRVATLTVPGAEPREISLARRTVPECLAEELRRLDADEMYGQVVTAGLPLLWERQGVTHGA